MYMEKADEGVYSRVNLSGTAIITKVYYRLRHKSEAVFCAYKQSRERSETGVMLAYKHGSDRFRRATRTLGAKRPGSAYTETAAVFQNGGD